MRLVIRIGALIFFIAFGMTSARSDQLADIRARVRATTGSFKDMTATVVVTESYRDELRKMGKSFAETYELKKAGIAFRMPDNLKMNGQLGVVKVEFISADDTRVLRIPSLGYRKRHDISDSPVLRTSSLDIGLVTDAVWDIYTVNLARTEKDNAGGSVYVLRIEPGGSRKTFMVWIEAATFKLLRIDRLLSNGDLKIKTLYKEHKKIGGVWIPTRAEVYNGDMKLAAVTETKDIQINTGIDGKEFE